MVEPLCWHALRVDRLLDLRHASRLEHYDAAFAAQGRQIEVSLAAGKYR